MTTQEQVVDTTGAGPDSQAQTVSRSELDAAITARQAAKERARLAEEKLAALEAAEAQRARDEAEAQGRFKDLATAAEARAAELEAKQTATTQRLEALTARHRATVEARLESLPEATRQKLAEQLGEAPSLEALENAVSLAESLQPSQPQPSRNLGGSTSAGRQGPIGGAGKVDAKAFASMTRADQKAYVSRLYGGRK